MNFPIIARARAALGGGLVLALLGSVPPAQAADLITDWAVADGLPTALSPAWLQTGTGATLGAGVLDISTSFDADNTYFLQDSASRPGFDTLGGASIEARLRLLSSSSSGDARAAAFVAITQGAGWGNALFIDNGRIFVGTATNTRGATAALDTSVFHTYRIDLGASAGGSASFDVFVDGVATLSSSTYNSASDNGGTALLYWGEGSVLASGSSQWQFVRDAVAAPVPEPATIALWLASLVGLALNARRRLAS